MHSRGESFAFLPLAKIEVSLRRAVARNIPVAVPDKIFWLALFLDFIGRGHSLTSLPLPQAALGSLPTGLLHLDGFVLLHFIYTKLPRGIVCIFAVGKNRGFAPSSRREQRSSALHLIIRFPSSEYRYRIIKAPIKGAFIIWWSRGESNPCPKAIWKDFLRAQFVIYIPSACREQTPHRHQ